MRLFGFIPIPSITSMMRRPWFRTLLVFIGIGAILAAIWYGFPMTGIAIMATVWLRATVIGVIVGLILLNYLIKWIKRRRAAKALEQELLPEPVGDGAVLNERMSVALEKLKKSGGKTYLYDLPWYVIIGPPGAGKTTALRNAGIEFPGSDDDSDAIEGFGGTRNCDWWFAEDAVLIDTAGRYTTQDSDVEADQASWNAFLEILKRGRPNQPINGVILAFSVEDMMNATEESLTQHAETVRARLAEVHEILKIDFPVYVLFTKSDLISGFREYFSSFSQTRRRAVWGSTFQTRDKAAQTWQDAPAEFDALVARLSDEIIDRLNEEPDGVARISIFGLPGQMALLRDNVGEFLRRVFEPTRYKTSAILRGFYFTSGTQEGTPIDQVLGAMSRNDSDSSASFQPAFMSGKGKSFFLHDLLKNVIFEERGWVSHDARAVRRTAMMRTLAMTLICLATLGAMGALGYSFWQNATLVRSANAEAITYFGEAQPELQRETIDDTNPSNIMPHLQNLRQMTAGFGDEEGQPLLEGLGLGQRNRINNAAERAYSDGLERMLRPRMILHMENTIPQLIADENTAETYRALKVYILLGGQQSGPADDNAIQTYFEEVWDEMFPNLGQSDERDQMNAHVAAMLELDADRTPIIAIDQAIVTDAQNEIADLPLAQQAYASIKDRAALSGVPDFVLTQSIGGRVEDVFRTRSGAPLDSLMVPSIFTFEGYWGFFLEELTAARDRLEEDKWVLGEAAGRVSYETQLAGLERELHRIYQQEFEAAWNGMLGDIEIAPMSVDAPSFDRLAMLASPVGSPLLDLVEAVEFETRLDRLYEEIADLDPAELAAGGLGQNLGSAMLNRMYQRSGIFSRVVLDSVTSGDKVQAQVGNAVSEETQRRQVERISEAFADWHLLLEGDGGPRPIDAILTPISDLRDNRRLAATRPTPADDALLQPILSTLTVNNTSLPAELAGLLNDVEGEFRTVAEDATMAELNRALNENVAQYCEEFVTPHYPFGNGRPLAAGPFGEFFGPGGRMDQFYTTHLQAHVTRTANGLQPVPQSSIGERLSRGALRQFELAEKIRTAFFASGSPEPSVSMFVTHVSSSDSVALAFLTVNGTTIQTRPDDAPATILWPGQGLGATLELFPEQNGRQSRRDFEQGRWAIVEFLRSGRANVDGNKARVRHDVGGRVITYEFEFDAATVPFLMPELGEFSCPTSMD